MNRENFQKFGLIIALVITGVTLPTSIISLTRDPTIINNYYYDNYYNYYNQTYYGNNETIPDYSKSLESFTYIDVYKGFNITRTFNLSTDFLYHSMNNDTSYFPPTYLSAFNDFDLYMFSSSEFQLFLEMNQTVWYIAYKHISLGSGFSRNYIEIPFHDTWTFFYLLTSDNGSNGGSIPEPTNFTIMDEILKI